MKSRHLHELVDPVSQRALTLEVDKAAHGDVLEGSLHGESRNFPVRRGIPSFVPENAQEDQTIRSFAQKWSKHRYYRTHTARFYTDWYLSRYGFSGEDEFVDFLRPMKRVLDAGTGAGRDATNFAARTNGDIYAVDTAWEALVTLAKEVDHENLAPVHADVNALPFPDEFFDFINCDQVIHHTPDPPRTFANLRRKLADGGTVCCYVYRKKSAIREFTDDHVREQIQDLPIEAALEACEAITKLGRSLAALDVSVKIEDDIPLLGIRAGQYDIQRFFHWNVMKCFWNDDFDFFTNNIVNFDWYHPVHCFRYEPEEFRSWFDKGWDILRWDVREAGMSCRAVKI